MFDIHVTAINKTIETNMMNGDRPGRDKVASADQDIQFYVLVKGKIVFYQKLLQARSIVLKRLKKVKNWQ